MFNDDKNRKQVEACLANDDVKDDEASAGQASGAVAVPVHVAFKAAVSI